MEKTEWGWQQKKNQTLVLINTNKSVNVKKFKI